MGGNSEYLTDNPSFMISGSMMKLVLILLPVVHAILNAVSFGVQRAGILDKQNFALYIVGVILPAVMTFMSSAPEILMGIAFTIPVYEKKNPDCTGEMSTML